MESEVRLQLKDITKQFNATRALYNVNMEIWSGEVHAVLGQNGAGKSTLVKILAGVYKDFQGQIIIDGKQLDETELNGVIKKRIGVVHQEFPLVPQLTVAENIYLGRFPRKRYIGDIDWKQLKSDTEKLLSSLNFIIDPEEMIENLNMGERQLISIARALSTEPDILVFDEATSTLTKKEVNTIFDILHTLTKRGTSVIFISHRIEEILHIADRVTVLRDGESISTVEVSKTDRNSLIQMMAGREVQNQFPKREHQIGEVVMEVKHFSFRSVFKDCSFSLRKGEILGIAGLVGSGRPELIKAIYGAHSIESGELTINGRKLIIKKPKSAMNNGVYYITSDRRKEGMFLQCSIQENTTLAFLEHHSRCSLIDHRKEKATTNKYIKSLSIKTTGPDQVIGELSGGNQQKVIMARWLCGKGQIFMFDEPTRGLDVGVKYDVYELMNKMAAEGGSIIMISSELPELLALSDRVIVMHEGRIVTELNNDESLDQEKVLSFMMGQENRKLS